MKSSTKKCAAGLSIGSILLLLGIGMTQSGNFVFNYILRSQMTLSPNSSNYALWKDLPLPIRTSMFLFNVTNAEEFSKGKAKPQLEEVGPYVFDEFHKKVDLVWNDDNGTVTYKQIRTFQWRPDESAGHLMNDTFTLLNVPAATVGATAANLPAAKRFWLNLGIGAIGEKLFVQKSAREILFDGYKDPLLSAAEIIHNFNVPIPGLMDKFGFYYARNGSDWWDGVFNMYTGASDIELLGQVANWNYSSNPEFFKAPCGDVEGAGDFFSPNVGKGSAQLYSNDLCRPIVLNYTNPGSVKGVPGNEYRITPTYFANSSQNEGNWCFEPKDKPLPSGIYNASACRFGAPIFMSQPHFYQADPYFAEQVANGSLNPDKSKHETVFIIEPQSGIPISVTARFQVNVLVDQLSDFDLFKHVPRRTFFPVIWFESKFDLADSLVSKMWFLSHLRDVIFISGLLTISLGSSTIIVAAVYYFAIRKRDEENSDNLAEPILRNASLEDDSEQELKFEEETDLQ